MIKASVYFWGAVIWVSSTSFQKSDIVGWPHQPPKEKLLKFNGFFWKLVDETQITAPREYTVAFIKIKKLFLGGLRGLQSISKQYERPCIQAKVNKIRFLSLLFFSWVSCFSGQNSAFTFMKNLAMLVNLTFTDPNNQMDTESFTNGNWEQNADQKK